ncbi:MAG: four helix bundle protein [Paludibacteraceae bacterium]
MCIVLEEIDESLFWLELIEEANLISSEKFKQLKTETEELVKIFSVIRKNLNR